MPELPAVITEAELRADEWARLPLSVSTVFVVEIRASYLAFPQVPEPLTPLASGEQALYGDLVEGPLRPRGAPRTGAHRLLCRT